MAQIAHILLLVLVLLVQTQGSLLSSSALSRAHGGDCKRVTDTKELQPGVFSVASLLHIRGGASKVIHIASDSEFDDVLSKADDKLVIVDFSASWCGPCKMIAPAYDELSEEYANSVFLKVDVDEVPTISQRYQVMAMPTFLFIKKGDVIDRFAGASVDKLRDVITNNN